MPPGTSSFTKNRDRLLEGEIAAKFLQAVLAQPRVKRLLSSDQFSVDGTLIEAWASIKSFRRKDGSDQEETARAAMRNATSVARSVPTRHIRAPPTRRPSTVAQTLMPPQSTSLGPATTRWMKFPATVRSSYILTEPSMAKSTFTMATKFSSPHVGGLLLQQPVRCGASIGCPQLG